MITIIMLQWSQAKAKMVADIIASKLRVISFVMVHSRCANLTGISKGTPLSDYMRIPVKGVWDAYFLQTV